MLGDAILLDAAMSYVCMYVFRHTPLGKEPYISAKRALNFHIHTRCHICVYMYCATHRSEQSPTFPQKEPHISAKGPYISAKEPWICKSLFQFRRCTRWLALPHTARYRALHFRKKSPTFPQKEPYISTYTRDVIFVYICIYTHIQNTHI